jgi:hypothetical protein
LEHWRPLEDEHWTLLEEHSALDPCLLDLHASKLDMCHLELENSTCGPNLCRVKLLVVDLVHFVL